jgi:hypothetical protein
MPTISNLVCAVVILGSSSEPGILSLSASLPGTCTAKVTGSPNAEEGTAVNVDDRVEDLQAVSQHMQEASARIQALETEKRTVDPASARFRELSDEIEILAEDMRRVSHAETGIAHELREVADLPTVDEADEIHE